MENKNLLGVIGFGNMANAILGGIIDKNLITAQNILVYEIDDAKKDIAKEKGFVIASNILDLAVCKYILMAVKPQSSKEIFAKMRGKFDNSVLISIMAGISKTEMVSATQMTKICRCMPNTPALIGKGITAIDAEGLSAKEHQFVFDLFNSVGKAIDVKEGFMNAVTAVSGSGPAYVYMFIDSFIKAGQQTGLSYEQARELVLATVIGSAEMVRQSKEDIGVLIDRVCSKGGTTIEGVKVLKEKDIYGVISGCVKAAKTRAEELSNNK